MRKIIGILKFLIVALLINVVLFFTLTVQGYSMIYGFVNEKMFTGIDIYDDFYDEYEQFTKKMKGFSYFFYLEQPDFDVNYDLFLDNVKYLQQNFGVKYVVLDVSYIGGLMLNDCVQTENYDKLSEILDLYGVPMPENAEKFLISLTEYNALLTSREKLQVIGINPELSKDLARNYINLLFSQLRAKRKSAEISNAYSYSKTDIDQYYQNMYDVFVENEQAFKEYFVDKFFSFSMAIQSAVSEDRDENEVKSYNFNRIVGNNIRSKYVMQAADLDFLDDLFYEYPSYEEDSYVLQYFYDDTNEFDFSNHNESEISLFNNGIFKYFEHYNRFIHKINKKDYTTYETNHGNQYIIVNRGE